jgi:hypothetical protein
MSLLVQFRTDGVKEESTVGALPRPDLGGTFSTASIWVSVLSSKTFVEVPFFFSSTRETVDSSVNFPCALILVSWINSAAAFIAWRRPTRIWRNFSWGEMSRAGQHGDWRSEFDVKDRVRRRDGMNGRGAVPFAEHDFVCYRETE